MSKLKYDRSLGRYAVEQISYTNDNGVDCPIEGHIGTPTNTLSTHHLYGYACKGTKSIIMEKPKKMQFNVFQPTHTY